MHTKLNVGLCETISILQFAGPQPANNTILTRFNRGFSFEQEGVSRNSDWENQFKANNGNMSVRK